MRRADAVKMDREICASVWTSPRVQRLMETLAYDIGPRPAGSTAMKRAAEFLGEELRKIGARNVHTEPVGVLAWRAGESRLELTSPWRRACDSIHHVHSAAGEVRGPLVDVGAGTREELDRLRKRVGGAVLLVRGHTITGGKVEPALSRLKEMCARGAAAILMRRMYPGYGAGIELASVSGDLPVPVLGVSHEEGNELASAAGRGKARVKLQASGRSYRTRCVNLVAEMGNARGSREVVILGAHLDHFHITPGALDDLTGVVTLAEIARALSPFQSKFRRTLRLIVYTGEEYGFIGSKAYVRQHADELDYVRFVFNMDGLFPGTARGVAVMWAPAMRDYVARRFQETQCEVDVRSMFCMSSDYLPFMLQGIAAARPADFHDEFPDWSHTRHDTPDKVPPEWIRLNAMTYAQLLIRVLTDPKKIPTSRKSPEEVHALVEKEDAREAIECWDMEVP